MVSQLTAYAEILCLLMTLFSAGASARNDIFLQSACSLKFVQVKDGVVIADGAYGDVRPQIFTLEAVLTEPCFPHCGAAITIYSKEAKRYICLDANGRPKSRRLPPDTDKPRRCLFYEQMDGGAFRFQSVEFPAWYLGFHKNEIFTLEAVLTEPCFPHCGAAITIYSKEAKRYICLDANGRPKSRRLPPDTDKPRRCLFYEQMDGGAFRFQSVEFPAWYLGFHKNGKPIAAGTPGGGGNGGHPGPRARGRGGGGKGGGEGAKGTVPTTGKTGGREKRRRQINEKCFNFERSNASSGALDEPRLLQPKVEQQNKQQQQQQQQQPHQHRHKQKLLRHQQLQQQQQQQQQQSSLRELPDENVPPVIGGSQGNALTEATATGVPGPVYPPHPHRHKHGSGRKGKGSRKAVTPVAGQPLPHPNLELAAGTVASSTFYSTGPSVVATVSEDPPSSWKATRRPSHLNLHPLIGDVEAALEAATKQRPRTPGFQPSGMPPLYVGHPGGRSANGANQRRPEHYLHQQSVPPASQSGPYGGAVGSNTSLAGSGSGGGGGGANGPRKKANSGAAASNHGRNASKVSSKAEKRMLG